MEIEAGKIITLNNQKEYICVSKKEYQGKTYLYLISNFKPLEIMFAEESFNGSQVIIKKVADKSLKLELLSVFQPQNTKLEEV